MIKAISKTSIHFGLSTHALSGVMRTTDNFSLTETLKFIRLISNISGACCICGNKSFHELAHL